MALGRVVPRRRAIARLADRTGGGSMERYDKDELVTR